MRLSNEEGYTTDNREPEIISRRNHYEETHCNPHNPCPAAGVRERSDVNVRTVLFERQTKKQIRIT